MHLLVARLPSIVAAMGVLIFSMLSLRNLGSKTEAMLSGIVLATTYEFFRRTREISLDLWQLCFIMVVVWLITKAIRENRHGPILFSGIPLGLALLCKPLVALLILPIFVVWLVLSKRSGLIGWLGLALTIGLLIAAPWHVYMYETFGHRFTDLYFGREIMERAQRSDQPSSIFFYLKENALTYWPWLIGLVYAGYLAAAKPEFRKESTPLTFGFVWVLTWLVALSLFADRKPNYGLPLYPMLSWIVASGLARIPVFDAGSWVERHFRWIAASLVAALVLAALLPIQIQAPPEKHSVALIDWIRANSVDSANLAYDGVESQDISYVYVKTGKWMKSLASAQISPNESSFLVVKKVFPNQQPPEDQKVIFHSGPFYVVTLVK
jgi:4-amino-4-deoxy-L-arabinose transferase-like glycosyltransferase